MTSIEKLLMAVRIAQSIGYADAAYIYSRMAARLALDIRERHEYLAYRH